MKPSRRNIANAKAKKEKLRRGPPVISKYGKKVLSPDAMRKLELRLARGH